MSKGVQNGFQQFGVYITKLDKYPKSINATFKGKQEFKTLFGGIVSLIIHGLSILLLVVLLRRLLNRQPVSSSVAPGYDFVNDK